jgi:hypothetical protein
MTRVGYARVSTREQNVEAQTDLLTEAGCEKVLIDKVVSGKPARPLCWEACLDFAGRPAQRRHEDLNVLTPPAAQAAV